MASSFESKVGLMNYPMRCAHAGGRALGRENSIDAVRQSLACSIDTIEVDVRRSHDGVLYCHHGSVPFGFLAAQLLFRYFSFARIQQLVGPLDTLEAIAAIIPPKVDFYLDVKESAVSAEELDRAIQDCDARRIWIAAYDNRQLASLMRLNDRYVYVYNSFFFTSSKFTGLNGPDLIVNIFVDFIADYLPAKLIMWLINNVSILFPRWRVFDTERNKLVPFSKLAWTLYEDPRRAQARSAEV